MVRVSPSIWLVCPRDQESLSLQNNQQMKIIEVVAAIIHRDGRILATQRGYGEYKGWWEFPGGKIEPGETEEQAIVPIALKRYHRSVVSGTIIALRAVPPVSL